MTTLIQPYSRSMYINFTVFWLLYILSYLILKVFFTSYTGTLITTGQVSFDFIGFYIGFTLFKKSYGIARKIFFWWSIALLLGFIADTFFNIIVNVLLLNPYNSFFLHSLYEAPFLLSLICHNIAWIIVVDPIINIKKGRKLAYQHTPIVIVGIIIFIVFLTAFFWNSPIASGSKYYQFAAIILEIIGFIIVSICFVATNLTPIRFLATGYLIIIACDLTLAINFIYRSIGPNNLMDVGWVFGLMCMGVGLYGFKKLPVSFKYWSSTANTIQLQLTFWVYILSFLSLGIFIALNYIMFSKVTFLYNGNMKVLACILIILSILILWFSYIVTKKLLQPLHKMREAIKEFVSTNKPEIELLDVSYDTIEFHQLNNFIRDSFLVILERQKIEKAFADSAAQVVHDLGSPLTTMEVAIKSLEKFGADKNAVSLLKSSVLSARGIAGNLLSRYKNVDCDTLEDDIIQPRYVILSSIINKFVQNKRIEWNDDKCNTSFKLDLSNQLQWAFISPLQMSRALSNLLNNAYESLNKNERNIVLHLSLIENNFELIIEDNGCGIPADKINDVLMGQSLKPGGHGIGLSHAVEYFKSLNGSLQLESILGVGTKVRIIFPVASIPAWYQGIIKYNRDSTFVILDDDISVHNFWQKKLDEQKIKSKHFISSDDFLEWYYLAGMETSIIFLIDYELHQDKYTGLDIIWKLNLNVDTYLVTCNAESFWLQDAIAGSYFKLIPKSLMGDIILQKEPLC